jgi:hypothetical protein
MFVRRMGAPPETPPMPSMLPRPLTTLLPPPPPLPSTALALPWNGGDGSMAACHGAPPLPNRSVGVEASPLASPTTLTSRFHRHHHRPGHAPTPTWRPTTAKSSAEKPSHIGTPSEPGSSPPLSRRGRFPAFERPRTSRWGRICHPRLAATALVARACRRCARFGLPAGVRASA